MSAQCQFTIYNGVPPWQCECMDAERVQLVDGDDVYLCSKHRSWAPALAHWEDYRPEPSEP